MLAPVTIPAATEEIRTAIGIIALLHAGEQLTAADMKAAVELIDRELLAIERAIAAPTSRDIPILTLAEVAARATHRARPARPALQLVNGGLK